MTVRSQESRRILSLLTERRVSGVAGGGHPVRGDVVWRRRISLSLIVVRGSFHGTLQGYPMGRTTSEMIGFNFRSDRFQLAI
jgi:hypothetical protein